uniref:Uncharacterized protein n=1 Tax=viral metagenome TaxID=1070528 RepID=A0A6H1ZCC9_9ZZZZ
MTTILGEDIKEIRPSLIPKQRIFKDEHPVGYYNCKPITVEEHTGKVIAICVKILDDRIFELSSGTHLDVCRVHDISTHYVKETGWKLENGNYLWR